MSLSIQKIHVYCTNITNEIEWLVKHILITSYVTIVTHTECASTEYQTMKTRAQLILLPGTWWRCVNFQVMLGLAKCSF